MRAKTRAAKLVVGELTLPHPLLLTKWESQPHSFPNISAAKIEQYFDSLNMEAGVNTKGQKALKEGRSMSVSVGRVRNIEYNDISPMLQSCFLRGEVLPQTRVNAKPYLVWILVFKNTGIISKADCHCIAGLSGMCKHVAALLYTVSDIVGKGLNKACTSQLQTWHQPAKVCRSGFMHEIQTPKASPSMDLTAQRPRRDNFDPRPLELRQTVTLGDLDLDGLADITNGRAAILRYAAPFRNFDKADSVPDLHHCQWEEDVRGKTITLKTVIENVTSGDNIDVSEEARDWVVEHTEGQSDSQTWFKHRVGRITASIVGNVMAHVTEDGTIVGATHTVVS